MICRICILLIYRLQFRFYKVCDKFCRLENWNKNVMKYCRTLRDRPITRAFYRIPTIYKKKKTTAIYCKTIVNIDQRKMPKVFDKQTFAVSCKNCRTVYTLLLQEKQNGKPLCLYIKKHDVCSCRLIVVLSNAARNDFLSFSQIKVKKPFPFHCQRT